MLLPQIVLSGPGTAGMGWYDGIEDAPDWYVNYKVWRGEHVGKRLWWWLVGMPPVEELRETYGPGPFTREEEARIRELVREEVGHESDSG
jgi:hypothetical protein